MTKLLELNQLKDIKSKFKRKKIVLCHGVFDLLHIGHINYFKSAKKLGDILIVSVTHDNYVNKGPGRPAFTIENRIRFLNEINCIDYTFVSNHFTAEHVIKNIKPNFYCKGSDYSDVSLKEDLNLKKELQALKSCKGKFQIIREESYSSSKSINDFGLQNFSVECKDFIKLIRKKYSLNKILNSISNLKNKKILIVGEIIIDKYITTEAIGKSGKEPMMVVKKKNEIKFLGGSGYVANLCSNFSNNVEIVSFLGQLDSDKKFVLNNLNKKIKYNLFTKSNSPTILKTRYLDDYKKSKILGIYNINDQSINNREEKKFFDFLKKNLGNYDIVVVNDYGHGIITNKIRKLLSIYKNKFFLNTQINSFNRGYHTVYKYKKVNSLIINESELRYETSDRNSDLIHLAKKIKKRINVKNIIITRGNLGSLLIDSKNKSYVCPAFNKKSIDTIGAGDTFFALLSMCAGSKIDNYISLLISSLAASYSTNQLGNINVYNFNTLTKQLNHILK